jgi:hypothetical protein
MQQLKRFWRSRSAFARIARAILLALAMSYPLTPGGAVSVLAQESQELLNYPETHLGGIAAAELSVPEYQCRNECTGRRGCAGFDYSPSTNACRLFATVSSAYTDVSSSAATRIRIPEYHDPVNSPQEPAPMVFNRFSHYDLGGYDMSVGPGTSVEECENSCRGLQGCQAFTFNAWNQKCFLKNGTGALRLDPRATTGVLAGLNHPGYRDTPVTIEHYGNYIISGRQLGDTLRTGSRDQCESFCWGVGQCIAFSFSPARLSCVLFSDTDNRFAKSGVQSGAKIQQRP